MDDEALTTHTPILTNVCFIKNPFVFFAAFYLGRYFFIIGAFLKNKNRRKQLLRRHTDGKTNCFKPTGGRELLSFELK